MLEEDDPFQLQERVTRGKEGKEQRVGQEVTVASHVVSTLSVYFKTSQEIILLIFDLLIYMQSKNLNRIKL